VVDGFRDIALADSGRVDSAVKAEPLRRPAQKRSGKNKAAEMRLRLERTIRKIPRGKVSTYGAIARAAGFPGAARQVAAVLRRSFGLPWQRVLGSGGEIKLRGDSAIEQRLRLEAEGVRFRGRKADMKLHEFKFR
jgi:methylated-DNA-protein-cysteine methyltransferase related protein